MNRHSGKRYVGKTSRPLKRRIWEHAHAKLATMPICVAIEKYGIDVFDVEILEMCSTLNELNLAEKKWIAHFDTFHGVGYNCTAGGDGLCGLKHTVATRQKMSRARLGKKMPPRSIEHRRNIAKAKTGVKRKPFTIQTRRRMSEAKQGKKAPWYGKVSPVAKRVAQYDKVTGQYIAEFESTRAAGSNLSSAAGNANKIAECCRGIRKSHLGYTWVYIDDVRKMG